jgi:hypothetical protein
MQMQMMGLESRCLQPRLPYLALHYLYRHSHRLRHHRRRTEKKQHLFFLDLRYYLVTELQMEYYQPRLQQYLQKELKMRFRRLTRQKNRQYREK